ncbi:hypothetical protein EG68_03343, partial [Paragonimus skrjabini miyazakii]
SAPQLRIVQSPRTSADRITYAVHNQPVQTQVPITHVLSVAHRIPIVNQSKPTGQKPVATVAPALNQFMLNGTVQPAKPVQLTNVRPHQPRCGSQPDETYHYPSANMNPLGVPSQLYRQTSTHQINQQGVAWKSSRPPPPYELALTLRQQQQQQQRHLQSSSQGGRQQGLSVSGRSTANQTQNGKFASNKAVGLRRHPQLVCALSVDHAQTLSTFPPRPSLPMRQECTELEQSQSRRDSSQHTCHPNPAAAPMGNTRHHPDAVRSPDRPTEAVPYSPPTKAPQRPAPPSYHQVVAMSRYSQQQQQQNKLSNHQSSSERPLPPTRTVAALSNSNHVSVRSSSASPGVTIVRPPNSVPPSSDPRKQV